MKSRKAQTGIFTLLFFDIAFILLYPLALSEMVNVAIDQAVASGNFVGLELFLITGLHIWIWLGVILVNIIGFYFGGNPE